MRLHTTFAALALLTLGGLGTAQAAGPTASALVHVGPGGPTVAVRYGAPPPPRYEAVPRARRGQVWVPGHWEPRGPRHVWVRGYWAQQRPGYHYRPSRWEQRHGHWDWRPGGWVQARPMPASRPYPPYHR